MAGKFTGIWFSKELLSDKRFSWVEKSVIAYHHSFGEGKRCFASDQHIANQLGIAKKSVSNAHSSIRKKTGIHGREFPKQGIKSSLNREVRVPQIGHIDISIDTRENIDISKSSLNRVVKQLTPRNLSNPLTILLDAEKEEAEKLEAASATVNNLRDEYISARRKQA